MKEQIWRNWEVKVWKASSAFFFFLNLKYQERQWNVRNLSNWELGVSSQIPGSDHELLIAQIRLKLKKVGKTTRPFKYDLNQIPYNYTVEVKDRFKGLDLKDRVPEELWMEKLYRRQGSRCSQEKEMQKGKMAVWGGLTNSWDRKRS